MRFSPADYAVIIVATSMLFVAIGLVALVIAIRAPESKHDLAVVLTHRGLWCLGIGIVIAIVYRWCRRLKE